ncbi:MAG: alpha/beta fold hydrolase [Acidimicrobiales bacterium]|nr:alpha/beta fold hydrolase [Acidimicrobiales bacterium]
MKLVLLILMGLLLSACLPIGTYSTGQQASAQNPSGMPPGANDWTCKPTALHPYPVILLHGTAENANLVFQALSPMLYDAGYCVFALDYGQYPAGGGYGLGDIAQSAGQLSTFVDQVLSSTGAKQVDIVGHSQGGMMPRYYMKFLSGAAKVNTLVGLAPSNHGTTLANPTTLQQLGLTQPAWAEQWTYSSFITNLNASGDTVAGPTYVVIETSDDEIVQPYTSAFLSGANVTNILVQNQCPSDNTGHIGLPYDSVALQDVMDALMLTPSFPQPVCGGYGPTT